MRIHHAIAELATVPGPVFLAIGVFDGVHLGHQAVIRRALADAQAAGGSAVVVTFKPHPLRVTRPDDAPRLLTSTAHKAQLIEQLGVNDLLIVPFTAEFAALPPEDFVIELHAACSPLREICVGHSWEFGKKRAGNLALLKTMGDRFGFDEIGIPAVEIGGEVVSSTLIRAAVEAGDLAKAARLLGRDFTILGTVVPGDRIGRTLGFPTANLSAHNEQFPPNGVYAVEALHAGRTLPGVVNIGTRPTIENASGARVLELHLFDFSADIYGQDVEVFFRRFLRPEQKFAGLDALKAQIGCDVARARQALGFSAKK
ncbi:MAG: bifunctional riboflavin kinase/FAD synthetase [Chthoniobacteraceae bacterium]|nr:bifunctional riboflavin kinase/FAD synthetase [Chthoniobacteraceae bacterium]